MRLFVNAILISAAAATLSMGIHAQPAGKEKNAPAISAFKGDPPPNDAGKMPASVARRVIARLMETRASTKSLSSGYKYRTLETSSMTVGPEVFYFKYIEVRGAFNIKYGHETTITLKDADYFGVKPEKGNYVVYWPKTVKIKLYDDYLTWEKQSDARMFANALNRLIWDAHRGFSEEKWRADFAAKSAAWQRGEGIVPPAGWEKHRILAEQRFSERDLLGAVLNYEAGLEEFSMWPEGWFNAALLYEALEDFASAADRMKNYLILLPNAPDARAAREKIVIWEDKAKKGK
jgi:hypothetical protein